MMIFFSETKFHFCGDEYIFAEISNEMEISSTLKAISITNELKKRNIPGIIEIYPNNTSYLVRYDPNIIEPMNLLDYLHDVDNEKNNLDSLNIKSRIIEIPILYDNERSTEISKRYQSLHKQKTNSNFEYVMNKCQFNSREQLIEAHSKPLYFVTALGFKPGTAWCFPLVESNENIIQAPKYKSPRPYTPERSIGIGGAFSVIYPTESSGSYQLIGRSAVPVYDIHQRLEPFKSTYFLAKPGDLWKFRPISIAQYRNIREQVFNSSYQFNIKHVTFSATQYDEKGTKYIDELLEGFYDD